MTITEAATVLGLAPSTLRRQRQLGKLRASKMGSEWFVSVGEVERYAREHLRRAEPPKGGAA
jgi:excisionase family DNA binding protein